MPSAARYAALVSAFVLSAFPASAQSAADRLVAERVLRLGGAVILEG